MTIVTVAAAGSDTDKFLVLDGSGNVDYRTGSQVLSDIGASGAGSSTAADDISAGDGAVSIETTSGNITIDAQANDADVIIKVDDGGSAVTALTLDGSDEGNAIFVNDVQLKSDSALLEFGADLDTTLTHTDGTGLTLNSTNKLTFGDTASFVQQSADGTLRIDGEAIIDLNASTRVDVSGDLKVGGEVQTANIGYTDGDNAITIADGGGATFPQAATFTSGFSNNEQNITNVGDIAVDTISGDDDSNTTIGFPGSDVLTLNTGGSERVRVDASGRVGIGNAAMSSYTGDTSTLVVGDTGDGGASIKIAGSTSATQRYAFTDTADTTDQAYVSYNHGTGAMALATEGSDRVTIDSNGDVGLGLTDPTQRLHIKGQTAGNTLQGWAMIEGTGTGNDHTGWLFKTDAKTFTFGAAHANSSSVGANMMYWYESAGGVLMTLSSSGALSKSSGSFLIDHPLESMKDTHDLRHSFVEGPQADNIYRGTVTLSGGTATVNVDTAARMTDGTFAVLNGNVQAFTSNESGWDAVRGSVSGNVLTISSEDNTSTASVSWMVVGERKDQHMIDTEWTDSDGRVITEPEKRTTPFDEDNGEE